MPVKIRLQRMGRRKRPYYHIIVADARAPRDGRFIEQIGAYNPMTSPATIDLDREKALEWLSKGAQPTETVRAILRFKGVLYRKHLLRGVQKGAMTQEEADLKYESWVQDKEARIAARVKETLDKNRAFREQVSGSRKPYIPHELEADAPPADDLSDAEDEEIVEERAAGEPVAAAEEPAEEGDAGAGTEPESPSAEAGDSGEEASSSEDKPE